MGSASTSGGTGDSPRRLVPLLSRLVNGGPHSADAYARRLEAVENVSPKSDNWRGSMVLDGCDDAKPWRIDWIQAFPFPTFSLAYVVHRYYRRHRPRRLPVLTPLKLPELYASLAVALSAVMHGLRSGNEVYRDKDLLIIELAGRHAQAKRPTSPAALAKFRDIHNLFPPDLQSDFTKLRDGSYQASGVFGKLAWWHYHAWSDQKVWNGWAALLYIEARKLDDSMFPLLRKDVDVCVTHLANYYTNNAAWSVKATMNMFLLSIPVGVLSRWTRRPMLYLPMNGIQRLLAGAWIYLDAFYDFRRYDYIKKIREKRKYALVLTHFFGSFEEDMKCIEPTPWL